MNREEHESYQRRIDNLEHRNKQLLDQLMKCDLVTPRVIHVDNVSKESIDRLLQQENTQLKVDITASQQALKISQAEDEELMMELIDTKKQLKQATDRERVLQIDLEDYKAALESWKNVNELKDERITHQEKLIKQLENRERVLREALIKVSKVIADPYWEKVIKEALEASK